jgi:hypothetical protein
MPHGRHSCPSHVAAIARMLHHYLAHGATATNRCDMSRQFALTRCRSRTNITSRVTQYLSLSNLAVTPTVSLTMHRHTRCASLHNRPRCTATRVAHRCTIAHDAPHHALRIVALSLTMHRRTRCATLHYRSQSTVTRVTLRCAIVGLGCGSKSRSKNKGRQMSWPPRPSLW